MASADAFKENMQIIVNQGVFEGYKGRIVNPIVVPDGEPEQRKVLVVLTHDSLGVELETSEAWNTYILPRQLDIGNYIMSRQTNQNFGIAALTNDQLASTQPQAPVILVKATPITDPMDPALDRFRPSTHVVKQYINRTVPGGMVDTDYFLKMRDQRDSRGYSPNIAMVGETQSGKTMLVQVLACLAAERDGLPKPYPVFTLSGSSGITSYDLFGQTTAVEVQGREALVWMEGLVPMALRCGGFLYLDEWNAVPPSQAVAVHPVLDDRRQFVNTQRAVADGHGGWAPEVVTAHPQTWVIATINPGYKGTQTMAEATSNRFRWVPWDYDQNTESTLVPSTTIRVIGDTLRNLRNDRVITIPVGTSALQRFNHDCATFGVENALWVFKGLFPPNERTKVETVIQDSGWEDLLKTEYPDAPGGQDLGFDDDMGLS